MNIKAYVKIFDKNSIALAMELNLEHPNLKNIENYILDGTQEFTTRRILGETSAN